MHRGAVAQSVERPTGPSQVQLYRLTWVRAAPSADIRYKYTRFRNVERKKSMHRYIWPLQDGDVTIYAVNCRHAVKYRCFIRTIKAGLVRHCTEVYDKPLTQLPQVRFPALFLLKRKRWRRMSINKAYPVFISSRPSWKLVKQNKVRI